MPQNTFANPLICAQGKNLSAIYPQLLHNLQMWQIFGSTVFWYQLTLFRYRGRYSSNCWFHIRTAHHYHTGRINHIIKKERKKGERD